MTIPDQVRVKNQDEAQYQYPTRNKASRVKRAPYNCRSYGMVLARLPWLFVF